MINEQTIRQWWNIFVGEGNFTEVRILGKFQYSGYFRSADNLIEQIKPYTELDDEQCYFVLNDIDEACYGRQQCEKMVKSPKVTTSDQNITHRKWVLIDYDPVRVTGTNATDEEFELAHKKAQDVYAFLRKQGFNNPVICKSGNGWHTVFRCDLPNDEATRDLLSRFLQSISVMFTDSKVDIDESVFNAARVCKLYGTVAKKGANLDERPWRMSEIVYVPDQILVNDVELFRKVADMLPKEEPKPQQNQQHYNNNQEPFELESFLRNHGIGFKKEHCQKWDKFILDHCFFNPEHKGKDAAIIQMQSGAIKYTCLHNSCQHHTWQEMRQALDPNAYAPKPQQERQYQQRNNSAPKVIQKAKYEIKEAMPELGEKWLSMTDIKKIDIYAMEKAKTGFSALDKSILGLIYTEVTVLSGSNSSGKSSWLNTLILNIINQGVKCALWSGELPPYVLKAWIQMVAAGKRNLRLSSFGDGKCFVPNNVAEQIDSWLGGKLFIYNNDYGNTFQQIFHDMDLLIQLGVRVFILDNLFSMNIDLLSGDKLNQQKELIVQIKEFAKKNNVHIILVAHPRKVMTFLRKNDISGTSDLTNAVDNVFILHRVNNDFVKAGAEFLGQAVVSQYQNFDTVLEVCKNRQFGVVDTLIGMYYESESRRFKNFREEDVKYGWEEHPTQETISFNNPPEHKSHGGESKELDDNGMLFSPPPMDDNAPF